MLRGFPVTFALPGTITSDATFFFEAPCDMSLIAVSACANNASTGQCSVGTASDPNGYLDDVDLGDSDDPTLFELSDFDGALVSNAGDDYPHYSKGDIVAVNLNVDGSTDPVDPCIVLWFTEG